MIEIMYAIAFDFDTDKLKKNYPGPSFNNAYKEVRDFLADNGFKHQQGTVYYGNKTVTQVSSVLAVMEMSKKYPYLKSSVKDIRILRLLDEPDDLMPVVVAGNNCK